MTEPKKPTRIGDMNGWTSTAFKLQLVATPIIMAAGITLGTWLVKSVNAVTQAQAVMAEKLDSVITRNYSRDAARADHLTLRMDILEEIARKYPPPHLTKQVEALENRVGQLETRSP